MNAPNENLGPEQLAAIQSDLRAIPDAPVGRHLTLEQNLAYANASLPVGTIRKLDEHLASCLNCATNLERWLVVVDLLAKLFQRVREKLEFRLPPTPEWAFGFKTKREVEITGPEGMAGLYLVENLAGDLELRFGSKHLECAGRTLRLHIGDWHRDIPLQQVDAEEVGAQTAISREEREKFLEGAVPEVELLP